MFEYINPGFLLMSGLIFFILLIIVVAELGKNYKKETHKIEGRVVATVFTVLLLIFLFWDATDTKNSIINNKANFNKGVPLECSAGFNTYLVQKSTGWKLNKGSFIKDDLIISIKSCQTRDKGE